MAPHLRKTASCPALFTDSDPPHLEPGAFLKFKLYKTEGSILAQIPERGITVTVEILKCFLPFTLSQVLLVRMLPTVYDLEGDFVVKLYDRRLMKDTREDWGVQDWSAPIDHAYCKYTFTEAYAKHYARCISEEPADEDYYDAVREWDALQKETGIHQVSDDMYRTELECYRRLRDLQGTDIPRCYGRVELIDGPTSRYSIGPASSMQTHPQFRGAPGLLLQHIPNAYTLQDLYDAEPPIPIHKEAFQYIVEDAVRIVNLIMSHEILNRDVKTRNSLIRWDPVLGKWKVLMIDFGNCIFRKPDESLRDWREQQANEDEEGAIGRYIESLLKEKRGGGYVHEESEYAKALSWDFMMEDGPRI